MKLEISQIVYWSNKTLYQGFTDRTKVFCHINKISLLAYPVFHHCTFMGLECCPGVNREDTSVYL